MEVDALLQSDVLKIVSFGLYTNNISKKVYKYCWNENSSRI